MNTEQFRENWTEWHAGRLDAATAARMAEQVERSEECRRYDRQMRQMLASLERLPLPDELPAEPVLESARRPRPVPAAWVAAAATVVLAFAAGVLAHAMLGSGTPSEPSPEIAEAVDVAPGSTRSIQLAVSSPRTIDSVEFVIELPPEVELEGYPGQRVVSWEGRLAEGRSRLTLPLRIGAAEADAEVTARIRHAGGEREIRVPLLARTETDNAV